MDGTPLAENVSLIESSAVELLKNTVHLPRNASNPKVAVVTTKEGTELTRRIEPKSGMKIRRFKET